MDSGKGKGFVFPPEVGLPGTIVASNISSDRETGVGSWTDGEKIRAIRDGVGRDGRALFPMMPYEYYRHLCDEELSAIYAYLKAQPSDANAVEKRPELPKKTSG
ncbi:MAG: hypothetical protein HY650_01800 [Acidobacteria bacterium]|nr:hypothetical protein [Acidobacteriota bacterium]